MAGDGIIETLGSLETEIASVAGELVRRGWAEAGAGNLSVDVTEAWKNSDYRIDNWPFPDDAGTPDQFSFPLPEIAGRDYLISASGARMRELHAQPGQGVSVIRIDDAGKSFKVINGNGAGNFRPTSEILSHLSIQRMMLLKGDGRKAVLHTHATQLITLCHSFDRVDEEALNVLFRAVHPEAVLLLTQGVGWLPFIRPRSDSIALTTARSLEERSLVIWDRHGVVGVGPTLSSALDLIETADKLAGILLTLRAAKSKPRGFSEKELDEVFEAYMGRSRRLR